MPKFKVTITPYPYTTEVEAEDKDDAIDKSMWEQTKDEEWNGVNIDVEEID